MKKYYFYLLFINVFFAKPSHFQDGDEYGEIDNQNYEPGVIEVNPIDEENESTLLLRQSTQQNGKKNLICE